MRTRHGKGKGRDASQGGAQAGARIPHSESSSDYSSTHPRSQAELRQVREDLIRRFKKLRVYAGLAFILALLGLAYYISQNFETVTESGPRFAFAYVLIAVVVAISLALIFSSSKLILHYQKLLDKPDNDGSEKDENEDAPA